MKCSIVFFLSIACIVSLSANAQTGWPQTITTAGNTIIKIYQPQPESFNDNILQARAAFSMLEKDSLDPVFGVCWFNATLETDKDSRTAGILALRVSNMKFPGDSDNNKLNFIKATLEKGIPALNIDIPLDELLNSPELQVDEKKQAGELSNEPPNIIYANRPGILVLIDGEPRLERNNDWDADVVINTPNTIVKSYTDFYLYASGHWYIAASATGPYEYTQNIPASLARIQEAVDTTSENAAVYDEEDTGDTNAIADIIVSTEPAELIQSNGDPDFSPLHGTNLLYVSNSANDIFLDIGSQQYYILISGRWYKAKALNGPWQYVAPDSLPGDFAKIPEGSPKDNVLASVPGTNAAKEAVMDAQIPQTAKVDRRNAMADITYDGDPKFEDITGTRLQYAVNTQSTVIRSRGRFYAVDNGVWFESDSPFGPWQVCVSRPVEVNAIPPSCPVYNIRFVFIYDVTPDFVYMGYTSGYLNAFIIGPTVVYGTGFHYRPWWGRVYYPRPYTWGFNIRYNPWFGWSLGWNWGFGRNTGWWGPAVYRPRYVWNRHPRGFYGNNHRNREIHFNPGYHNNVYRNRKDAIVRERPVVSNRPGVPVPKKNNNIFTDRNGNIYQRKNSGKWKERDNNQWKKIDKKDEVVKELNRQQQNKKRGQDQTKNFNNVKPAPAIKPRQPAVKPRPATRKP